MVCSGPYPPVRLVAPVTSALDGSSSVLMNPLPKDLALIAVGSRVGRRGEDIITSVVAMDGRPGWPGWRRGVHRGCIASSTVSAGMRWPGGATAYGSRRPQLIILGEADEAPDGGPPFIELLCGGRKIGEQLRTC